MNHRKISLTQYLVEQQREHGKIPAQLRLLIEVVARACKGIAISVNKGALGGVLGSAETENVQGEVQKKLDVIANEVLLEANSWGGHLAAMASEEMDSIHVVPDRYPQGEYLLLFDPLDGSSNIDVNVSIGTIFSVLKKQDERSGVEESDFAQTTVMYRLCGDGPSCSIADGEPSVRRGIVLRREALELALYTLRYVDGVGAVIAFFPPRKGEKPTAAFLFTKRQFSGELSSPLRETFPHAKPPVPGRLTPDEHRYVDALTARWGFLYRVDRSKSGARVLVLERPQTN